MTDGQLQLASLQNDIATRLRPVCPLMSDASFGELVRDIAAVELKYSGDSEASAPRNTRSSAIAKPRDPGAALA